MFIWINETKKRINEFNIGYMMNPGFNVNKTFIEQMKKCMFTTFGAIAQPFIKSTLLKKKTIVLILTMFYEKRAKNIAYRVCSCSIYTIIERYVCIHYLAC